ncbi:MAG: AAA family ATPase, partial [Actinomyces bouchesdurhonensis]|nr:AAA family ATPase [Actinomyces bouchesdurhonensis]
GAGKSTLIDAITFALYGDVARTKDASKDRLRSNHISDSDPSEADLVFEVATGIYRVTRTPAYTPAGKKSQRNSKSTLTRVVEDPDAPDGWRTIEAVASGPRDVGYEIPTIVGLDKDQFLQTIVLPQGKFSQFLTATSDAREQILRDIFDTQIYSDFTKALTDAAASSKRGIEERRVAALGAFERVRSLDAAFDEDASYGVDAADAQSAAATEADQLDASAEDASAVRRWAQDACARAREAHAHTLRVAEAATAAAREASRAFAEGRALAEAQSEHARVSATLAALTASQETVASDRERARSARRALAVAPFDAAVAEASARLESAGDQVSALSPALGEDASVVPESLTTEAVAALGERAQEMRDEATRTRGSLEEALAVERSLPEARARIESLRSRREQTSASIASIEAEREELPGRIEQATQALRLMRADADTLPEAASALRAINERLDASMQADLLRSALLRASDELREATAAAKLANAAAADGHD